MKSFKEFIIEGELPENWFPDDVHRGRASQTPEEQLDTYQARNDFKKKNSLWGRLKDSFRTGGGFGYRSGWKKKPIDNSADSDSLKRLHAITQGPSGERNAYDSMFPKQQTDDEFLGPTLSDIFKQIKAKKRAAGKADDAPVRKKAKRRTKKE